MSTKIHTAYRTPLNTLWPTLWEVKRRGRNKVRYLLDKASQDFLSEERNSPHKVKIWLYQQYRAQSNSSERNLFDFDVSVSVRQQGKFAYLIPHCDGMMSKALDFMESMNQLEPFGYWDNVDPPEDVDTRKWNTRKKTWEKLLENPGEYLVLEVISSATFYELVMTPNE